MTRCYRIYTERKNLKWLCKIVAEKFPGFTVYKTIGFYNEVKERAVCIEIITGNVSDEHYIKQIALKIKGVNKQESVFITRNEIEVI
jgi:hypothetical protein